MKVKANIVWIFIALLLALFCRTFLVAVYKIPTVSMAPTFWPGDFILSSQIAYGFRTSKESEIAFKSPAQRGDLVVFQFAEAKALEKSSAHYVKRIIAVAGDSVEIKSGRLLINDKPCVYVKSEQKLSSESFQIYAEDCDGSTRDVILSASNEHGPLANFAKVTVPMGEVFVLGDNRDTSDDSRDLGSVPTVQIASKVTAIWMSFGSTQDFISGPNRIRWNRILTKPR